MLLLGCFNFRSFRDADGQYIIPGDSCEKYENIRLQCGSNGRLVKRVLPVIKAKAMVANYSKVKSPNHQITKSLHFLKFAAPGTTGNKN
jgi:hypothetical protein